VFKLHASLPRAEREAGKRWCIAHAPPSVSIRFKNVYCDWTYGKDSKQSKDFCKKCKAGRTRTDKIGVGAGADIGGTGISCNFMTRQYTGPTRQSYRDDHRRVGAMPATPSINRPAFSVSVMRYVRVDVIRAVLRCKYDWREQVCKLVSLLQGFE
jgi:hypothetical protein